MALVAPIGFMADGVLKAEKSLCAMSAVTMLEATISDKGLFMRYSSLVANIHKLSGSSADVYGFLLLF